MNNEAKVKLKNAPQETSKSDEISSKQTDSAHETFLNKFTYL